MAEAEPIIHCESCFGPRITPPFLYGLCGAVAICRLCFENERPDEFKARRKANFERLGIGGGK